jgi:hypothetical protein
VEPCGKPLEIRNLNIFPSVEVIVSSVYSEPSLKKKNCREK